MAPQPELELHHSASVFVILNYTWTFRLKKHTIVPSIVTLATPMIHGLFLIPTCTQAGSMNQALMFAI